ncbi:hypothetical protein FF38_03627 [Lucilia cuprina]|uniref:Uncharacterized protein n=1 Tax=Lucilia cuprina TaxID=7375 RepID=A0A0L0C1A9_LUCCU|nr:hypothetical protein FF38_03627 [Lucilia cuprina]
MTATPAHDSSDMAAYLKRRITHLEERLAKSQRYAGMDPKELNDDQKLAVSRINEIIGIISELKNVLNACNRFDDASVVQNSKLAAQNAEKYRGEAKQETVAEVGQLLGTLLHRVAQKARSFDGSPHNPEDTAVYTLVLQLQSEDSSISFEVCFKKSTNSGIASELPSLTAKLSLPPLLTL